MNAVIINSLGTSVSIDPRYIVEHNATIAAWEIFERIRILDGLHCLVSVPIPDSKDAASINSAASVGSGTETIHCLIQTLVSCHKFKYGNVLFGSSVLHIQGRACDGN